MEIKGFVSRDHKDLIERGGEKKLLFYYHLRSYHFHLLSLTHTATFLHLQLSIFITSHLVSHTAIILFS